MSVVIVISVAGGGDVVSYPHTLGPPDQHSHPRRLGAQSSSPLAHTLLITPQRLVHHAIHSARRELDDW